MPAMAAVGRQLPRGQAPVDPQGKEHMAKRPIFVKFRATEVQRGNLIDAAKRSGTTSSALLRRFVASLPRGQQADFGRMRAEWAAVRQVANQVLTFADEVHRHVPETADRVRVAADSLHRMASRHLGPIE